MSIGRAGKYTSSAATRAHFRREEDEVDSTFADLQDSDVLRYERVSIRLVEFAACTVVAVAHYGEDGRACCCPELRDAAMESMRHSLDGTKLHV